MKKLIVLFFILALVFVTGCEKGANELTLSTGSYYDKNNMHNGSSLEWIDLKNATDVERTICGADAGCSVYRGTYELRVPLLTVTLKEYSDEVDGWVHLEEDEVLTYTITDNNEFTKDKSVFVFKNDADKKTEKYDVKLEKENEKFEFGKLSLEFTGGENGECEKCYYYNLNIKYDGKEVGKGFFDDEEVSRINSSNMSSTFTVYKIDEVYILVSGFGSQCYPNNVLIFNTEGKTLEMYSNADIDINNKAIDIEVSPEGNCMGEPEYEFHFEVSGLELKEKKA